MLVARSPDVKVAAGLVYFCVVVHPQRLPDPEYQGTREI
jgi:hypothetical protein